jgi:D-glycero-D-manno-heptose 1,7-bisphosphate phosphatase
MKKLIILDRDGVINEDSDDYIKSPEEWHPIPGSLEAIALLNQAGFEVVVATNQSGLARGYYTVSTLHEIHAKMHTALVKVNAKVTEIYYCPHGPEDNCTCRKPRPGLLLQIKAAYGLSSLSEVPFVGDSLRDIEAALEAGAIPVLVKSGKGEKTLHKYAKELQHVLQYDNLLSFAKEFTHENA